MMSSLINVTPKTRIALILSRQPMKFAGALLIAMSLLELTGCTSRPIARAPVEDRSAGQTSQVSNPSLVDNKILPGINAANAGKPGYYTVKPGDTLLQVGRNTGQTAQNILRWNNLDNPNKIEVGQVLRVAPPEGAATTTTTTAAPKTPVTGTTTATSPTAASETDVSWMWPSNGALLAGFDEVKNKGMNIAGRLGDPVVAAADGTVIHAGPYLRYGNLIILKHNETFLTAYAHNQTLLVKEDQMVRKGQRIADMGNSDADRVMLHFELRRHGKPVDPARYLPPR